MDDLLIIGGGVVGLAIAYELAGQGLAVAVIDRHEPGQATSWAGAGILPPARFDPCGLPQDQLRGLSHQMYPAWVAALQEESGIDPGYRACGGIYLACSPGEAAALRGAAAQLAEDGLAVERVAIDELPALEPALAEIAASGQVRIAYLAPGEAQIRNPRYVKALLAACRARGVRISGETPALEFVEAGDRLAGVVTPQGTLTADQYCLACGVWTEAVGRQLGLQLSVEPVRGQMLLYRAERPPFQRVLNVGPRYLVPRDDGRVLVGSTEEEVGFDASNTPDGVADLQRFAAQLAPVLAHTPIEKTWAGLRPRPGDGLPYLGRSPRLRNLLVAAGHFRSGLHLSPGTAVVMSHLAQGKEPPINLHAFRLDRG